MSELVYLLVGASLSGIIFGLAFYIDHYLGR